ncbi:hypothetical protein Tco_0204571 [Tanacetum coccineum]
MAVLDSCPKHNMVAYLEKSEGNAEFHEIIDFLKQSSIHHALTVSPVVSTTFVEQFWTSAKSKIINNVRHITAKVAGKSVSISEASIRSDLLFDDADGIDSLPNQAIFDAIQLMGSKSTSWDQIPTNIATAVICLTSNQKYNFSKLIFDGKVTSLFATMLVQPTQDEGASSERPSEAQPTPSPAPTSEVPHESQTDSSPAHTSEVPLEQQTDPSLRPSPSPIIPDPIPETSGGNLGGHSSSDKSLSGNEGEMTLQRVYDLCLSLCAQVTDQAKGGSLRKVNLRHRESSISLFLKVTLVARARGTEILMGRTRDIVDEEKEIDENIKGTEDVLSTDKEKVSTDKEKISTDRLIVSTDGSKVRSVTQATQTPSTIIFGDDKTIAKVLLNISQAKAVFREKEKGVKLKDIEETDRPRPTSTRSLLTLKPLPKIDPKDKGNKKIEEEDEYESESDGIPEAEKKFKQLASDEEMARKIQEEWEGEEERNRLLEEKATNKALIEIMIHKRQE